MKTMLTMLVVVVLLGFGGCASSSGTGNPESAESKCKGTWDSRTGTCIGG